MEYLRLPGGGSAELNVREQAEISQVKRGRGILGRWYSTKKWCGCVLWRSLSCPQMAEAQEGKVGEGGRDKATEISRGSGRDVKEPDTLCSLRAMALHPDCTRELLSSSQKPQTPRQHSTPVDSGLIALSWGQDIGSFEISPGN